MNEYKDKSLQLGEGTIWVGKDYLDNIKIDGEFIHNGTPITKDDLAWYAKKCKEEGCPVQFPHPERNKKVSRLEQIRKQIARKVANGEE